MMNPAEHFLANLSHELRTPLNGIVGYSQLLAQTRLDDNQRQYVSTISSCCLQLVEILNDILDFSRLASGKIQINSSYFSVKEVCDEVKAVMSQRLTFKQQRFSVKIDEKIPTYIISDKQKIIQILINLISNANKFTQNGGRILLYITLENDMLRFTVEDNGIGIDEKDQQNLFQSFFQVNTTTNIKNGCGLGLAICKKLVELLGGEITCESQKDNGSIFSFTIKYKTYREYEQVIEKSKLKIAGKYILIINGNVEDRIELTETIFDCNAIPVCCSSLREAIKLLSGKRYPFSGIIFDTNLDSKSSRDTINTLSEIKNFSDLPIIGITDEKEIPIVSYSFFEQIIQKPIDTLGKIKLIDVLCKIVTTPNIIELNSTENQNKTIEEIKILLAEDVDYNCEMTTRMLNILGYKNIDVVSDGETAIKNIEKNNYDILLLDLKMPKISGHEVASYIKINKKHIRIAVITASISDDDKNICKENGVRFFLMKPFGLRHLKILMNKLIKGSNNNT